MLPIVDFCLRCISSCALNSEDFSNFWSQPLNLHLNVETILWTDFWWSLKLSIEWNSLLQSLHSKRRLFWLEFIWNFSISELNLVLFLPPRWIVFRCLFKSCFVSNWWPQKSSAQRICCPSLDLRVLQIRSAFCQSSDNTFSKVVEKI